MGRDFGRVVIMLTEHRDISIVRSIIKDYDERLVWNASLKQTLPVIHLR